MTTHQSNISYKGWNGSGYIILDPTTGTGAYLIDGGANGVTLLFIGMAVISFTLACIIESGGLMLITMPTNIAGAFLLGIGAMMSGLALLGIIDAKYCSKGFTLMKGGVITAFLPALLVELGMGASAELLNIKAGVEIGVRVALPVVSVMEEPYSDKRVCSNIGG